MYFKGKISRIGEVRSNTNATTGVTSHFRNIALISTEKYVSHEGENKIRDNEFVFELTGDIAKNFSLEQGTEVIVAYSSSVREIGQKMYESKYVYSVRTS